jgi:hypothetical protein
VAERTEEPAVAQRIAAQAAAMVAQTSVSGVPHLFVKELFEGPIGFESNCAAVLRGIHQGIVMPTSFVLKAHTRLLTKDIKDASGWRVSIDFQKGGRVVVTHVRREQSFGSSAADDFIVEAHVALTLIGNELIGVKTMLAAAAADDASLAAEIAAEFEHLREWNRA